MCERIHVDCTGGQGTGPAELHGHPRSYEDGAYRGDSFKYVKLHGGFDCVMRADEEHRPWTTFTLEWTNMRIRFDNPETLRRVVVPA